MLINITQHCTLRCPHCMQNAGPERTERMSAETFTKALEFAFYIGSQTVNISGGEPTSHPHIIEFVKEALDAYGGRFVVSLLSNGTFIRDHKMVEKLAELLLVKERLHIQISSYKGLYANYDELHKPNLKALRLLGPRCVICDREKDIQMKPLGRAESGEWYEVAKKVNGFPSCVNSALIAAQLPEEMLNNPGKALERMFRFCLPMVSYDGSIRMGESEQCKVVANVHDKIYEICKAISEFRPCGKCASFKWHFCPPANEKEKQVYNILYPNNNE